MINALRKTWPLVTLTLLGWGGLGWSQPALSQVLVPYTVQLDFEVLEQEGLILAQEAAQLAQFQQYELALSRAQLAAQLVPQDAQVWALLGSLYLQLNQDESGITALRRSTQLDTSNAAAFFALGSAYFRQANYQASVDYLNRGLRLTPENPGALFDLGNAHYLLSQYDQAIAAYDRAMAEEATFWPAVNNIGLVLYEQGDVAGAIAKWEEAVEISAATTEGGEAEPRFAIAVAKYAQGDTATALTDGAAVLQRDRRYADVEFLQENLWGEVLLADTATFLADPQIRRVLGQR